MRWTFIEWRHLPTLGKASNVLPAGNNEERKAKQVHLCFKIILEKMEPI